MEKLKPVGDPNRTIKLKKMQVLKCRVVSVPQTSMTHSQESLEVPHW